MKEPKLEGRIRYVKNWGDEGEHYLFEIKWSNKNEWHLQSAFPLVGFHHEKNVGGLVLGPGDLLNYRALTMIREWMKLGVPFHFE